MKGDGWYSFPPPKPGDEAARAVHFLSVLYSSPPVPLEEAFDQTPFTYSAVSAGGEHTCAINGDGNADQTKGTVRCWGSNLFGQSTSPDGVFAAISSAKYHTCGLRPNGTVSCWGDNTYGQAPR